MIVDGERKRVLVAALPAETLEISSQFGGAALAQWEVLEADSFERAHFILQHSPCDALVVDEGLYAAAGPEALQWLTKQRETPTLFLGGLEPDLMAQVYQSGVTMFLPRRASLQHRELLAAALERACQMSKTLRNTQRTKEGFLQCRRQVDRLVNLLWRTIPMDPQRQWFTQRHAMERLQEEVSRSVRHGTPFTVALGELHAVDAVQTEPEDLSDWSTDVLFRTKRRCDVAGSYGLKGFMLLMVHTPQTGGVACCRRLQTQFNEAMQTRSEPGGPVRACFGLSSFLPKNASVQTMLSQAEQHLETARAGAGDGVVADLQEYSSRSAT